MPNYYKALATLAYGKEPAVCPVVTGGTLDAYPDGIIGRPGLIDYNGNRYLVEEGLLVVWEFSLNAFGHAPYNQGKYRLMVPSTGADPLKLCAGIAALVGNGPTDNALTPAECVEAMRWRRLYRLCGQTCDLTQHILYGEGIASRQVCFLNISDLPNPSDYSVGHTCVEVQVGGAWKMVDIGLDTIIVNASGEHLSALDMMLTGMVNCQARRIAPTEYSPGGETATDYAHFAYRANADVAFSTDALLQAWHVKVFEVLGIYVSMLSEWWIRDTGFTPDQEAFIDSFGYIRKPAMDFDAYFYP